MKHEWSVGQTVAKCYGGGHMGRVEKGVVKRIMKQFVELEDGSKWKLDGRQHPRGDGWHFSHIEPYTDEHREIRLRAIVQNELRELQKLDLKNVALDGLQIIRKLIKGLVNEAAFRAERKD